MLVMFRAYPKPNTLRPHTRESPKQRGGGADEYELAALVIHVLNSLILAHRVVVVHKAASSKSNSE